MKIRKDWEIMEEIIDLSGLEFRSNALIEFEERHGGPLWYDLVVVSMAFKDDQSVTIILDRSLSKKMTRYQAPVELHTGIYRLIVQRPNLITGEIALENGPALHFEAVPGHMDLLILENPPFWKESLVLKKTD